MLASLGWVTLTNAIMAPMQAARAGCSNPRWPLELAPKIGSDLMEHIAGFAAIKPAAIVLIDPIHGDQAKTQHDDTAHCNRPPS